MAKPRLFIGSSTERLPVAKALQTLVRGCADAMVWNEADEFALGKSTLDGLLKVGQLYDFALLIFGQDDSAMIRGLGQSVVNDEEGTYAVIYLQSIKRQASALNVPWTTLAAYVAAHEIGHLILGTDHSPTGVMKASWNAKDMLAMSQNSVRFNNQQRLWIRGLLQSAQSRGLRASH